MRERTPGLEKPAPEIPKVHFWKTRMDLEQLRKTMLDTYVETAYNDK